MLPSEVLAKTYANMFKDQHLHISKPPWPPGKLQEETDTPVEEGLEGVWTRKQGISGLGSWVETGPYWDRKDTEEF